MRNVKFSGLDSIPLPPYLKISTLSLALPLNPTSQPYPYEMGRQPFKTQLQYVISSRWLVFYLYLFIVGSFDTISVSGI